MSSRPLREGLGAIGGAAGALPLVPLARRFASHHFPRAALPGAEMLAGDVKGATYAEVAVLLVALPAAAFLFGHLIPRLFESIRSDRLPAHLPGVVFGLASALWWAGLSPLLAITLASLASASCALWLARGRNSTPLRSSLPTSDRESLLLLFLAGIAWGIAARSTPLPAPGIPVALPSGALIGGIAFCLLALAPRAIRRPAGGR